MSELRIITASAGTGKTHRLVQLVVEALLDPVAPVRPEGLVAVTYTRAAAEELGGRLRSALVSAGRADLAGRLRDGRVGTLHSVCGALVRRHALTVGLSPALAALPPSEAIRLARETLDDVLSTVDPAMDTLAARLSQPEWRALVARILALARVNGIHPHALPESAQHGLSTFAGCFVAGGATGDLERLLAAAAPTVEAEAGASKAAADRFDGVRFALRELRAGRALPWREQLSLAKALSLKRIERDHPELLRRLADHTDSAELSEDVRSFVEQVFAIARSAALAFARRKQEARLLDFDDLLAHGRQLLDHPEVAATLAEELELVVADEFQDVSPLQLTLVSRLIALAGRGAWVGDEKQAIYSFQGSDPELVRASLREAPRAEQLERSFRSRPGLVGFCSDLFGAALPRHGFAADRVRLTATRVDEADLGLPLERWRWGWLRRTEADGSTSSPTEARAVACGVAELSREEVRLLRDVAVLCRTNAQAARVAIALRHLGVAAAFDRPGLLDTEEARLVRAGLALVLDPEDGVAATTVAWLGDAVDDPEQWLGDRLAEVGAWRRRAEAAEVAHQWAPARPLAFDGLAIVRTLRAERERIRGLGPADQVDAVIRVLGLHDLALRGGDSATRHANLDALRRVAGEYRDACVARRAPATLPGLMDAFRRIASEEDGGLQAAAPSADAVVVTTFHGSKGLEWPVVVLSGLDAEPRDDVFGLHVEGPDTFDAADPLAGRWLRLWPWPYGAHEQAPLGERAAGTAEAQRVGRREEAERARLLYVGFTRARDRLILAAGEKGGKVVWPWIDELGELSVEGDALIAGGVRHPCRVREVDPYPVEAVGSVEVERRWFLRGEVSGVPAVIRPSDAVGRSAAIVEVLRIGEPIRVAVGRRDRLGDAVHRFLASDRPEVGERERRAEAMLVGFGVVEPGLAARLVRGADGLWAALEERYPGAEWLREWPLLEVRADGRRVTGEADLVGVMADRLVLIDHKSTGGDARARDEAVQRYAGQLATYAEVLEGAFERPVADVWLHLPFRGELVRVHCG